MSDQNRTPIHAPHRTQALVVTAVLLGATFATDALAQPRSYYRRERREEYYSYNEKQDQLGFLGGPSFSSADASVPDGTAFDSSSRTLFVFSGFYEHQFMPFFGFRLGADYSQRGFTQATGDTSTDYSANYLEFPLQAKAQIPSRFVSPFVTTGPFIGFLVGNGATVNQAGVSTEAATDGLFNSFEFGWDFGGGLDFQLDPRVSLELSLRYSLGLTNAIQDQATLAGGFNSLQLDSLQLLAGFVFVI